MLLLLLLLVGGCDGFCVMMDLRHCSVCPLRVTHSFVGSFPLVALTDCWRLSQWTCTVRLEWSIVVSCMDQAVGRIVVLQMESYASFLPSLLLSFLVDILTKL